MSYRGSDDDPSVIKMRGLPYEAAALDVCRFFSECNIKGGPRGIYFCVNERNQPTGEVYVKMERQRDIDNALNRHKDKMGGRYIEIFESRQSVMDKVIRAGATNERGFNENRRGGGRSLSENGPATRDVVLSRLGAPVGGGGGGGFGGERGFGRGFGGRDRSRSRDRGTPRSEASEFCVKLRGLPWTATKEEIAEFLHRCLIVGETQGIHIIMDQSNRPSGDAYVELEAEDDVDLALKQHKKNLGSRYVEVFEANPKDVARAKDLAGGGGRGGGGRRKGELVTLRGLPYSCSEREIANWLSEVADPIDVVISMDRRGRPSGTAEAFFRSGKEAKAVAKELHRRELGHRYIECFYDGNE